MSITWHERDSFWKKYDSAPEEHGELPAYRWLSYSEGQKYLGTKLSAPGYLSPPEYDFPGPTFRFYGEVGEHLFLLDCPADDYHPFIVWLGKKKGATLSVSAALEELLDLKPDVTSDHARSTSSSQSSQPHHPGDRGGDDTTTDKNLKPDQKVLDRMEVIRRRRIGLQLVMPAMLLLVIGIFGVNAAWGSGTTDWFYCFGLPLFICISFVIFVYDFFVLWRCPSCRKWLGWGSAWFYSPRHCPRCGIRLEKTA